MRMALTGATGFIGRHLVRELSETGHELRCLVRPQSDATSLREQGHTLVVGDMEDEASLRTLCEGVDAIVHNAMYHQDAAEGASRTAREAYLRKNLHGGHMLLEFAAQQGVSRFLHISTLEVYGASLDPPFPPRDEDTPLRPESLYGNVKYALENSGLLLGEAIGFQALRPGWVFGDQFPRERNCWHPLVDHLLAGLDIPVKVGAYMIWVEDLVRLARHLLEHPLSDTRIFNAHTGFLDWYRVTEIGKELLGSSSQITGAPCDPSPRPIVAERIRELGVAFRVEEGVERTLEHIARLGMK